MKSFLRTSFPDDETVDSTVIEDSQDVRTDSPEYDSQLTAALGRPPFPHERDETLVVHPTPASDVDFQQEHGTFFGQEDEDESDTNRKLFEKTKLNWKFSHKVLFLRKVIAMEM